MRVTSSAKAFFEVVDVFIEGFSWGVSSQKSKGFALYETFMREMRVLKSLCRFKMCTDVKDSLGVKSPFPVLTRDWNKLLLFSGPLNSSTFAQSKQICSFDDGDTHTRSIDLVGVESAHSAFEVKDSQMKPETPNGSHATPHFWREMQMEPIKRDKSTSRDFVARGWPLRGQTRLAPLAERSTCSKSS